MSKFATLMIAAALLCPAFAQAMPKAPAMVAGDEETIPTPEKKATAHRAKKAAEASAAPAAAPAAPALIAGDEKTDPTPAKAKAARKLKKHAKKLPPPSDPSTTDNPAKP